MDNIEIPFGAKDSELCGREYKIPEGMEAVVKDGKVIVRRKESEDERIRKALYELFKAYPLYGLRWDDVPDNIRIVDVLDWLERQKEQKPAERQDYSGLNDLERAIHRGFLSVGVENVPVTIIKETAQECLSQMKPAEWSEEDEKMLSNLISHIEVAYSQCDWLTETVIWFKSLKNRRNSPKSNTNSPSWKPSKEQMRYLLAVINDPNNIGAESCYMTIKSLYNDLKKL